MDILTSRPPMGGLYLTFTADHDPRLALERYTAAQHNPAEPRAWAYLGYLYLGPLEEPEILSPDMAMGAPIAGYGDSGPEPEYPRHFLDDIAEVRNEPV